MLANSMFGRRWALASKGIETFRKNPAVHISAGSCFPAGLRSPVTAASCPLPRDSCKPALLISGETPPPGLIEQGLNSL